MYKKSWGLEEMVSVELPVSWDKEEAGIWTPVRVELTAKLMGS